MTESASETSLRHIVVTSSSLIANRKYQEKRAFPKRKPRGPMSKLPVAEAMGAGKNTSLQQMFTPKRSASCSITIGCIFSYEVLIFAPNILEG